MLTVLLLSFGSMAESGISIDQMMGAEVIIDPYSGLDYSEINVYDLTPDDYQSSVYEMLGDGYLFDQEQLSNFISRFTIPINQPSTDFD